MTLGSKIFTVLFVCTGNSARSILAEAILNRLGNGRFQAFSAGSDPVGEVHPAALRVLELHGHDITGLYPKNWLEFATPGAPTLDMAFTLCDQASGEVCPHWPGEPLVAHWGLPDPAAVPLLEQMGAFQEAYMELERRLKLFCALPMGSLDRLALHARLRDLGRGEGPSDLAMAAAPA